MMCEYYANDREEKSKADIEKERLLNHFSEKISENIKKFVDDVVLKKSRYIFARSEVVKEYDPIAERMIKVKKYYAYCTHCKKEYEIKDISKYNHKCYTECENCGGREEVRYSRYGRKNMRDAAIFITYEKSVKDKDTIVARGFYVARNYSGNYKEVDTKYYEISRHVFEPGKSSMLMRLYAFYSDGGWALKDRNCSWSFNYSNFATFLDRESVLRCIKGTRFENFPYEYYLNYEYTYEMTDFFYNCNKYPIIEQLYKAGFKTIADYIIKGWSLERTVKWKRNNIFEFLGINRGQAKEIKSSGIECTPAFLKMYKYIKENKLKYDMEEIKKLSDNFCIENIDEIKKYSGVKKMISYFEKQYEMNKEKEGLRFISIRDAYKTWYDYLRDCEKLKMDLSNKSVLMPKDLYKAHQNTIKQIKYEEDKILNKEIEMLAKKREKYKFEFNGLIIRPAINTKELIKEGAELHHCVGGYAKRYAEGKTTIMFIRKKDEPDKPYYTMEIVKGKIEQVRGNRNKAPEEDVKKFVEEYKKKVLSKFNKKVA